MLSNILKNNVIGSVLTVLLLGAAGFFVVLKRGVFPLPASAEGVLYSSLLQYNESRILLLLLSAASLLGGAFLLNFILNSNETLSRSSFFPAFVMVLISSEALCSYDFHPGFTANLLIILGMMRMMQSYRVDEAKAMFFDGAFMISSATLIYFPALTLLPMVFVCLLVLRPFVWREWALALMGIITPHLLAGSVMYVMGRLHRYYNEGMFAGFSFSAFQPEFGAQYFVLACIGFLFLLVIFSRLSRGGASRKIRQQKNINLLSFWLLLGVGGIFYEVPYKTSIPLLCAPPVAGLLGEWLGNFRRGTLSDFALLLLVTAFTLSILQIHGVF